MTAMEQKQEMLDVVMLESIRIATDGIHLQSVVVGQRLSLPHSLAEALVRDKLAKLFEEDNKEEPKKAEDKLKVQIPIIKK